MRIKITLLVLCLAGLGVCRSVADADETPQQAAARKAMEAKMADLNAPKAGANAAETEAEKAYRKKLMELNAQGGASQVDQEINKARANQIAAPAAPPAETSQPKPVLIVPPAQPAGLSKEEQDRIAASQAAAEAAMQKKIAEINTLEAERAKALADARAAAEAKKAEELAAKRATDSDAKKAAEAKANESQAKKAAEAEAKKAAETEAKRESEAKAAEAQAKKSAESPKPVVAANPPPKVEPKPVVQAVPTAPSVAPAPSSAAPTTRAERLAELLTRYRANQVTPHEYQAERAKILAETPN